MCYRILLGFLCLCISTSILAQLEATYTRVAQTVQPSPTAASLGQYGNYTLNSFSGSPDINIPLIDVQIKNFHLPISLSYQAGGIKVEDISSWIGTGWSLNYGGSITRSVVDRPDDYNYGGGPGTGILYENWYKPGYNPTGPPLNSFTNQLDPYGGTTSINMTGLLQAIRRGGIDTEPDIFFYDINGSSGKFFFDTGYAPIKSRLVLAPYRDIDINFNFLTTAGSTGGVGAINQFAVTDEKGNKYFFDVPETTTTTDNGSADACQGCTQGGSGGNSADLNTAVYHGGVFCRSAWYLSKIITASGDEIDYSYATENIEYQANTTQMMRVGGGSLSLTDPQGCVMSKTGLDLTGDITDIVVAGRRLTQITGPNFMVEFDANHNRQDIFNSQALTSIKLFSGNPGNYSLVKQFSLTHHYMADLSSPQLQTIDAAFGDSRQRLMLDTVLLVDQTGVNVSSYNFQYNETTQLPDRLAPYKDFWGYFCNNHCTTTFPKLYIYPDFFFNPDVDNTYFSKYSVFPKSNYTGTTFILPGANRNTDPVAIMSGTINKIVFPTGGYTQFTFEPHSFMYNGVAIQGGGIRLKQTLSFDGINHSNDVIKNYAYVNTSDNSSSSGVLFNLPIFAYTENAFRDSWSGSVTGPISPENILYYSVNLVRSDVSQTTLGGFDGTNVGYREITESQPNNGKIIRRYSVPGYFGQVSDLTTDGACDLNQSGFCDGYFQAPVPTHYTNYTICGTGTIANTPEPLDMSGIDVNTPYTFPFAPCPNYDWNRGIILQESYYNNAGQLQKSVNYQYLLFSPGNIGPRLVSCLKKGRALNYAMMAIMGAPCGYTDGIPRYDVIAPYHLIGNVAKVLSQVQTYEYDINGNSLSTTKTYSYSYNSLLPASEQTDRSDKSSTIMNRKYIADLNLSSSSTLNSYLGYQNLFNSHMIYEPVEQYVQKKNIDNSLVVTSGLFNTFKATMAVPDGIYSLRNIKPLTDFVPSTILPSAVTMDSRYQPVFTFDLYDIKQNLLQQTKVNDISRSHIWDYNLIYPIAEVQNAFQSDIAYTSFEADGGGNWAINSSLRTNGSGITGSRSYNLINGVISCGSLRSTTTYVVSYWSNNGSQLVNSAAPNVTGMTANGWTYYEHVISGATSVVISGGSGGGSIDELRLYPKGALMSTYTFTPLVGMTTSCDANNKLTYYVFDTFGRLKLVKDQEGNILRTFKYQYKEQQ
jgi:hypothetical protein